MAFINFILVNAFGVGLFSLIGLITYGITGENIEPNLIRDTIFWIVRILALILIIKLNKKYVFDKVIISKKECKPSTFDKPLSDKGLKNSIFIILGLLFILLLFKLIIFLLGS